VSNAGEVSLTRAYRYFFQGGELQDYDLLISRDDLRKGGWKQGSDFDMLQKELDKVLSEAKQN